MSLDRYSLQEDSYRADLELLDRYISFSSELLRLSLLILTGLGLLLTSYLSSTKGLGDVYTDFLKDATVQWAASAAVAALMLSAMVAVVHRYVATDAMAYHITSLRLDQRLATAYSPPEGGEDYATRKREEVAGRNKRLKISQRLLIGSFSALCVGAAVLVFLLFFVLLKDFQPR